MSLLVLLVVFPVAWIKCPDKSNTEECALGQASLGLEDGSVGDGIYCTSGLSSVSGTHRQVEEEKQLYKVVV